jgi:hypothetical protein
MRATTQRRPAVGWLGLLRALLFYRFANAVSLAIDLVVRPMRPADLR